MDEPEPADNVEFDRYVTDQRRERWQSAAEATGLTPLEWVQDTLDTAAEKLLRDSRAD